MNLEKKIKKLAKITAKYNKEEKLNELKDPFLTGLAGASAGLLTDYLIAKKFESKDGLLDAYLGEFNEYRYTSSWINFMPQAMLDIATTVNLMSTYIEYQKAKAMNESTWTKKAWMGIHATVALGSKIYSWMSGENIGRLPRGYLGTNQDFTSDRISFEKGSLTSLGALLFELASVGITFYKKIKEENELEQTINLDLNNQKIKKLPEKISELQKLKNLDVSNNELTNINEISKIVGLQELIAHNNRLTSLPDLSKLTSLTKLDLRYNLLTSLPEDLCKLIIQNKLDVLIEGNNFPRYENIIVVNNSYFAKDYKIWYADGLTLSSYKLSIIPDIVYKLTSLKVLNLSWNYLKNIPDEIEQLTKLKDLDLRYNKLESLPEKIGQLNNIEILNLDGNPLKILPKNLTNKMLILGRINNLAELDGRKQINDEQYINKGGQAIPILLSNQNIEQYLNNCNEKEYITTNNYFCKAYKIITGKEYNGNELINEYDDGNERKKRLIVKLVNTKPEIKTTLPYNHELSKLKTVKQNELELVL